MGELRMMSAFKVLVFGSVPSCSLLDSGRNGLRKVCRGRFVSFGSETEAGELLVACLVLVFEFKFPILVADKQDVVLRVRLERALPLGYEYAVAKANANKIPTINVFFAVCMAFSSGYQCGRLGIEFSSRSMSTKDGTDDGCTSISLLG